MKTALCLLPLLLVAMSNIGAFAQPATTQPSKIALERTDDLKANIEDFQLSLEYWGKAGDGYEQLILSVQPLPEIKPDRNSPLTHQAQIDAEQARAIIDYLATEGFLGGAADVRGVEEATRGRGKQPYYMLMAGRWEQDLGWGLPMLRRLEGLRKVLKGDAGKAMDQVLDKLADQRKLWEAATKPAEQP